MLTAVDGAYFERNQVVAALARLYPSGVRKTAIEGWDPAWHNCVFIDLPTGQVSWHFHDREAELFAGLPAYTKPWDGHTTPEKYERLARLGRDPAHSSPPAERPGWFTRMLIGLGLIRWCGRHIFAETHGDERNRAGARFQCMRCSARAGLI